MNNYYIQDKSLEHMLYLLFFEVENKGVNGKKYVDNVLNLFSNYFIKHFSNIEDVRKNRQLESVINDEDLEIINSYIDENIYRAITIEELADEVNLSKFYFLKEFKQLNVVTPYQYIVLRRIEEAKRRIKENQSMTEIAYALGFSDSSHFTRTFKKVVGVTPKEYK